MLAPGWLAPELELPAQAVGVLAITASQAVVNHFGISATARLSDFSGYLILIVSAALAVCLLAFAPSLDGRRLISFENYSGPAGGGVWLATDGLSLLFAQGLLLPAYTITGFDASAHIAEETVGAVRNVPRAIVGAVLVSGAAGWVLLCALVISAPSLSLAAAQGEGAFVSIVASVLPWPFIVPIIGGIVVAQYLCGLATVTSASRMAFAFARDRGLPFSQSLRWVCPRRNSPAVAIWAVAATAVLFTLYTPMYATITAVCTIFLYLSYVIPTALGACVYGRAWKTTGPWNLGRWYRPLAMLSVAGCIGLTLLGMRPPNEQSAWVVGGATLMLAFVWFGFAHRRFPGPPSIALGQTEEVQ